MEWHAIKKEEVIRNLGSSINGLSSAEAERRFRKFGKNEIKEVYQVNPLKIFFKQFKSILVYILLAAIVISVYINHYIDASVITAIVLLNVIVGFVQQYKAEKSILKLRQMFVSKAKVFRDGKLKTIYSTEVVPGDIIIFEEGDKVLADCRILHSEDLEVNEAILTGESNLVAKEDVIIKKDGIISERLNMLYAGTTVIKGYTRAIVLETGMQTEFGKIALKLQEIQVLETPMQKKMDKFAKQISVIVIFLAAIIFFFGILQGKDRVEMFLTSIALIISIIPEGLPAIITISLAFATGRMLRHNVLIRRLPAAETLGSVTVICSDKTGTMTEEKMSVVEFFCNNKFYTNKNGTVFCKNKKVYLPEEKAVYNLIKTGILSSNARFERIDNTSEFQIIGDATEAAIINFALDADINKKILAEKEPRIKEISFSSERKMMSILRKGERENVLYCKGSFSSILEKSAFEFTSSGIKKLTRERIEDLARIAEDFERKGFRVMAFAYKFVTSEKDLEQALTFVGLMALMDPPRKGVAEAIKLCKQAGIKVKMITGDSLLTAKTIGEKIGITGKVIGGRELNDMSDEELLREIGNISIFARTEPKQKLRIVELLQQLGEQVAITGDGVNDILALKKADIGVAMGRRGSDIARDVSDMILLDDNFLSIVKGVKEGRLVYDNSKKATKFLLASNFDELLLVVFSIIMRTPLPLLPLQILWLNLVSDTPPAIALIKEPGEDIMEKPRKENSLLSGILFFIIVAGVISMVFEIMLFYYGLHYLNLEKARTMVLFASIGFDMLFVFSCRTEKPLLKAGLFSNKYIWYSVFLIIFFQLILIFTPLGAVFGVVALGVKEWLLILLASVSGLLIFEAGKIIRGRWRK